MAKPARLDYLILSCDKFWQCGELRRKRSRAVTQQIFLRLARVKFKRLPHSRRSFRPHRSARLLRLCIFASQMLRRISKYQSAIKPAHAGVRGKRTDKINGLISLVRNRGIFDPCRPCYSATNEPFAKTCRGMPPKYKSQIGISARDL